MERNTMRVPDVAVLAAGPFVMPDDGSVLAWMIRATGR